MSVVEHRNVRIHYRRHFFLFIFIISNGNARINRLGDNESSTYASVRLLASVFLLPLTLHIIIIIDVRGGYLLIKNVNKKYKIKLNQFTCSNGKIRVFV